MPEPPETRVPAGKFKQSVAYWCFNSAGECWDIERMCQVAQQLGIPSIELVEPEHLPVLKQHGLVCALAHNGMPGAPFVKGFNNPLYHEEVVARTKKSIDECSIEGCPNVLAFTGYQWRNAEDPTSEVISREEGADNCVTGLRKLSDYAAAKNVTLCLEHLNSRDSSHPMKGHPGYQGDDLEYVASIVRRVDSPAVRLLFDVYHVQVMHGDILRRLDENIDIIGHIHAAGCPGRNELDDRQEINYPAVMRKLAELGYEGYVGHEFLPTGDPLAALTAAVRLCDV